jgi:hypothetical protein
MASDVLDETPAALEYFSDALNSMGEAGKLGQFSGVGAKAAKFASKLAGPVALIASAISSVDHISDSENPGNNLALTGDIISGTGAAILIGGSSGPGTIIAGIGTTVVVIGYLYANKWEADHLIHKREKYLAQVQDLERSAHPETVYYLDGGLKNTLATGQLEPLAEQLDMTPEQIQEAAKRSKYLSVSSRDLKSLAYYVYTQGYT